MSETTIHGKMNRPWSTASNTLVPIGMPEGGTHPSLNQKMYRSETTNRTNTVKSSRLIRNLPTFRA